MRPPKRKHSSVPPSDETPPKRPKVSPPPKRGLQTDSTAKHDAIKPFWDVQSCDIGTTLSLGETIGYFKSNMRKFGLELTTIEAFGTQTSFHHKFKDVTPQMKLRLHVVEETSDKNREDVDIALVKHLLAYALEREPPAYLLVIASDGDYLCVLKDLREVGYNVMQAYTPLKTGQVVKDSDHSIDWIQLSQQKMHKDIVTPLAQALGTPAPRDILNVQDRSHRALVIWDPLTLKFPSEVAPPDYFDNIKKALSLGGLNVYRIDAYLYDENDNDSDQLFKNSLFAATNINLIRMIKPPDRKRSGKGITETRDHCDVKITKVLFNWALARYPPAPIFLISNDVRLSGAMAALKNAGFHVYLACYQGTRRILKDSATHCVRWRKKKGVSRGFWKLI